MDRAPGLLAALSTTKRCTDCAHLIVDGHVKNCGRTASANLVTGEPTFTPAGIERAIATPTGCGPKAVHFIPTVAVSSASAERRKRLQLAIEDAVVEMQPDFTESSEIVSAIQAALLRRFGEERITDVVEACKEYQQALEEADATVPQ